MALVEITLVLDIDDTLLDPTQDGGLSEIGYKTLQRTHASCVEDFRIRVLAPGEALGDPEGVGGRETGAQREARYVEAVRCAPDGVAVWTATGVARAVMALADAEIVAAVDAGTADVRDEMGDRVARMSGRLHDANNAVRDLRDEVKRLRGWKAEALPVMSGLQDLGKVLGVGIGRRITGPEGVAAAKRLRARAEKAEAEVARLTATIERGEASDGHHTHNELYDYRMLYNAHAARGWVNEGIAVVKSWRHSDGEECFGSGWFIVTVNLPTGQVSNHYRAEHWDLFDVPEAGLPPEYDGHTPADAADRLRAALAGPQDVGQP